VAEERSSTSLGGSIALSEVAHASSLARLGLTPSEVEKLAAQLQVIVEAVGKLSAADVSSVEATAQVGGLRNVTRADEVEPGLTADEALGNSRVQALGFLRVPAIQ
jgi:aspartyl-tRNA(Asn)/glutamyl-tRNA(Gln) amidotransferase subunit C